MTYFAFPHLHKGLLSVIKKAVAASTFWPTKPNATSTKIMVGEELITPYGLAVVEGIRAEGELFLVHYKQGEIGHWYFPHTSKCLIRRDRCKKLVRALKIYN